MEGEIGVIRSIIGEIHCSEMQGDQMEGSIGVTVNIIDETHSWDIQGDQIEGENMVLHEI